MILSVGQLAIILLSTTQYCIHETKALYLEGIWLSLLIILQLIKIVTLSVWDFKLSRNRVGYYSNIMSYKFNASFYKDEQTLRIRRMKQHTDFRNLYLQGTTLKKQKKAAPPPPRKAPKR